jgi:hypothetical protein
MVETQPVGAPCGNPEALDEVHLLTQHIALIVRDHDVGNGQSVPALILTNLLESHSRIVINLESGDYADVYERDCGCLLGQMGLSTHLSTIRSYEKLTGEGVTFMGGRLFQLVEEILPARFGGQIGDYQIAEEEDEDGLTRVSVVVAPRVGTIDEDEIIATVMEALRSKPVRTISQHADLWEQGGTLRVVRREPHESERLKVLPLHAPRRTERTQVGTPS